MPKAGLEVMLIQLELLGYVRQSKLSTKNQKRLRELGGHTDEGVRRTAALVLELNAVAPGKPRQRWLKLWQRDRALFRRCVEAGFLSWEEDGQ